MNASEPRPPADESVRGQGQLVQDLLVQVRQLKIENERLRLETRELQERWGKPDPRVAVLEAEVRRLREELATARAELALAAAERDELNRGLAGAVDALMKAADPVASARRHG